ncbi:ATP-binding protein [Allocoprobacillus halotolerans]|uniref:histidine kinase n=1 Tax=Allocoprobacillus halotolerans TaxID=2944914 RepID=A0ABY5I4F0_9FIRM|nr:ATP-binding protein [Allocoprobacillus halotolerans]UTY40226.1 ATP-binding protein [Allocoprobacillus halotolerans]
MTKSILRYFIVILIVALLSSCTISAMLVSNSILDTTKHDMLYSLKLIDYALDYNQNLDEQIDELNPLAYSDETRISIIDLQGNVIADTARASISENHLDRDEVQEAIQKGEGYAQRKSETTHEDTLYVALYDQGDHIVRLSIPYHGITDYLTSLIPAFALSSVISFFIAFVLSRKLAVTISKPIIEISESLDRMSKDFRVDLKDYDYQEFNVIVDTIYNLSHRLRKSMRQVKLERIKIDEILKQMNEGFVLLDEDYKILSINEKAISILGNMKVHDRILDYLYFPDIIQALQNNIMKQQVEIKIDHNIYACYISRVDFGTTLLFVDITASKKAEKMRSEFFSNVSHELKTPMTSIRGYSDLLAQGVVQNDKQKQMMLEKIQTEVDSMSRLINDILMLSRLESMDIEAEMMPLKMRGIVEEVLESYEVELAKHDICMEYDFEDVTYIGNHQQIYTLLNNVIGNAIKYNKDHGKVYVDIEEQGDGMKIVVEDTGIGIPLADQNRVFERFYRVDKGRSKQRGGTGLGLAIVKHIVSHYKGTISLKSELNIGTTIEIVLPQQKRT